METQKGKPPKRDNLDNNGISIRRMNYIMGSITILVSIAVLIASHLALITYDHLEYLTDGYIRGQECAHKMQSTSDYLTEMARCFAETGDRTYLDNYFEEVKVTNRREESLRTLADDYADTEIYHSLEDALKSSVGLMDTEYYSMRLTVESRGYKLSEYPEEVRGVSLSEHDKALSKEEKAVLARTLVFDDNYHKTKELISDRTTACLDDLVNNIQTRQDETTEQLNTLILVERVLIAVLIFIILVIIILTGKQVIAPLIRAIPHIRAEKPIPVSGSSEFRYLVNTYNKIYEENRSQKEELAYEATHDSLTGVFNRKGFEDIMKGTDISRAAVLLIDIDRFKGINDTYGHEMGDRVLKRVVDTLIAYFRADDALCRIGGDEFVMIMAEVSPIHCGQIKDKISRINDILDRESDGMPPVTISVGVAFGGAEDPDEIYRCADKALYQVKENGRRGVAFYNS